MSILHRGRPVRRALASLSILVIFAVSAPAALAEPSTEPIGGQQLASPKRTVNLGPEATPLPEVWASTWLIADADTGQVLAHKGAHVQRAPASTLKMLTALTVLPQTSPEQEYVATRKAVNTYGSKVGLRVGKTYTMQQLWNAVFLPSANDAAIAVAQANGGVPKTVRQMNALADSLGAHDTVAKNTSGLDAPGQLSSAYDLALIARAGLKRPDFAGYASTVRAPFPDTRGKKTHTIYTTNRMLLNGWRGAIGVKTGFTSQAGRTFVGAAERKGRTLIVSLMGIKESTEAAATKLLEWGFDNADKVDPVGVLVEPESDAETVIRVSGEASVGPPAEAEVDTAAAANETLSPQDSTSASMLPAGIVGLVIAGLLAVGVLLVRRGTATAGRHR